jgi:hypothetical protein
MGKRSNFPRVPQDRYNTPLSGVEPLLKHFSLRTRFYEPCAGENDLIAHLEAAGHVCVGSSDIELDARTTRYTIPDGAVFITNPPWSRPILHAIIENLSDQAPTWLLVDTAWIFTQQAIPYLPRLQAIAAVRRLKWIPGTPDQAKDDCCWLLVDRPRSDGEGPRFHGRIDTRARSTRRRAA